MVKGIVNAFDHMEFCLVIGLTTMDGKWDQFFSTMYVSFATNFTLGSKYLLLAKKKLIMNSSTYFSHPVVLMGCHNVKSKIYP